MAFSPQLHGLTQRLFRHASSSWHAKLASQPTVIGDAEIQSKDMYSFNRSVGFEVNIYYYAYAAYRL